MVVRLVRGARHDIGGRQLVRWEWTWNICPRVDARMLWSPGFGDTGMNLASPL